MCYNFRDMDTEAPRLRSKVTDLEIPPMGTPISQNAPLHNTAIRERDVIWILRPLSDDYRKFNLRLLDEEERQCANTVNSFKGSVDAVMP